MLQLGRRKFSHLARRLLRYERCYPNRSSNLRCSHAFLREFFDEHQRANLRDDRADEPDAWLSIRQQIVQNGKRLFLIASRLAVGQIEYARFLLLGSWLV